MPYKSRAQQGYFHAAAARGELPESLVREFDRASKGQRGLPKHVQKKAMGGKAHPDCEHFSHGGDSLRHHRECGRAEAEERDCPYCDDRHPDGHPHLERASRIAQDDERDENMSDGETYQMDREEEEAGARGQRFSHGGDVRQEEREHPWMTARQADRVASDHEREGKRAGKKLAEGGKVGFAKLERSLAHEKGVTDPAALAASIGRRKYGKKAFQQHAAAGKKFAEGGEADETAYDALDPAAQHEREREERERQDYEREKSAIREEKHGLDPEELMKESDEEYRSKKGEKLGYAKGGRAYAKGGRAAFLILRMKKMGR